MDREEASKHRAVMNWLNPIPPRYPHDPPNILSLDQALQLVESVRDAESKRPRKRKATLRQNQRDCHLCGQKGHTAKDTAEDGSFKCPTRTTDAQTMSTELARLRAEFTTELAAVHQKDEQKNPLLQQSQDQNQHQNQQVQQNIYHHPRPQQQQRTLYHRHRHPQTQAAYTTALQKSNRNLPIWSVNYFELHHALQRKSGLARFVDFSGRTHFVRLYSEGLRRYVEEERESEREEEGEEREVLWPNVQVVVVGRGVGGS
ncbi:hypothetical protein COCMIDRAFT_28983 [Bipolaris oryzae ATCC 44560]|uniref:Zinc knuckle domain-containing protein n=1 Tax=Bipolaris oryzae ATCC 44560 TaxID=930090 RepID=W6Z426_COCMI|nr:uncharacterized protein COCMIDRAFT_28983 [Bipolaris oryzae ATCC 44560]EUC42384.1 hypothetical protein COCMIDRAFT_28983 [Bipolaris oryzae ATCC 44560]